MTSWFRVLALVLAVLPALWGQCPCCRVGCAAMGTDAKVAVAAADDRCPCCTDDQDSTGDRNAPRRPMDCDGCAGFFARSGAAPAPVAVDLPTPDMVAYAWPVLLAPVVEADACPRPLHGPAPPGPFLDGLRSVVLLI